MDILTAKAMAVKRHLERIKEKRDVELDHFLKDLDRQEIILFNLQMAIQKCVDIAAHIIAEKDLGIPGSTNDMLYLLESAGFLDFETTEQMVKAVGFRNLLVHEYEKIDLKLVYKTAHEDLDDLAAYLKSVFQKLKL